MTQTVHFASDAHFGAGRPEDQRRRVHRFVAWTDRLAAGERLYLLGDVFDFWVDYPTYMPKLHMDVLYSLRRAIDRGVEVRFVGGNHDVWCEPFFEETLGVPTLRSGAVVEHGGVRLRLHHGDGLLAGERSYRIFKYVVRHPAFVFAAKTIHPEVMHGFAMWLSRRSRARDRDDPGAIAHMMREHGRAHPHDDVDHLVIGHVHTPVQLDFEGWRMTCLGDWIQHFTVGRLDADGLRLLRVAEDGTAEPMATADQSR